MANEAAIKETKINRVGHMPRYLLTVGEPSDEDVKENSRTITRSLERPGYVQFVIGARLYNPVSRAYETLRGYNIRVKAFDSKTPAMLMERVRQALQDLK